MVYNRAFCVCRLDNFRQFLNSVHLLTFTNFKNKNEFGVCPTLPNYTYCSITTCKRKYIFNVYMGLTGKIWKCLIFWWWHKVSTNAFGLLWLSLNRNNLRGKILWLIGLPSFKTAVNISHHINIWKMSYPSTWPCCIIILWDSSLIMRPWNHNCVLWITGDMNAKCTFTSMKYCYIDYHVKRICYAFLPFQLQVCNVAVWAWKRAVKLYKAQSLL